MNADPLLQLARRWREDAGRFRVLGDEGRAKHCETYAHELESCVRDWLAEPLTLEAAVIESGFTYSALQKQMNRGALVNVGKPGSPRIRRCDLPAKGGSPVVRDVDGDPDLAGEVMRRRLVG